MKFLLLEVIIIFISSLEFYGGHSNGHILWVYEVIIIKKNEFPSGPVYLQGSGQDYLVWTFINHLLTPGDLKN